IESCADRLWLAHGGTVAPYDGDMDDYRRFILEPQRSAEARPASGAVNGRAVERRDAAARRRELAPLKQEAERWERESARLTEALRVIEQGLASPGLYERDPATAAELAKKHAKARDLLARAEESWLAA